ncbi:MAG: hypothetical protein GEU91_09385 [Rhizobiales bacterium]|nr:hypothetical protein [Hyphomicrobiales bacterium]
MRSAFFATAAFVATLAACPAHAAAVEHTETVVNGVKVDRYQWRDSNNRPRTVSLKKQGESNPGNGGYAVQMTYQVFESGAWRTVRVNDAGGNDGGFGYFVSHERFRDFAGGGSGTIARKVFGQDDSPLGRHFAVVGKRLNTGDPELAAHRFRLTYPRYGTVKPIPKDANGNDVGPTPVNPDKLKLYSLGITIIWYFQSGKDHPLIRTVVDMSNVDGRDRVNFDVRGPYGVMHFDGGENRPIKQAIWGDRFHFKTLGSPLTRSSEWTWKARNRGARYSALIAGKFEMGLVEPRRFNRSALVDGWSGARGRTSTLYNGGNGCTLQTPPQKIPCDWEWPYQSAQYSLPYDDPNGPTTGKKIAWGSAAYYGTGPSMPVMYDTSTTSRPFNGFPADRKIKYDVCAVLGHTVPGGLARAVAQGPSYNCANAP